MKKFISILLGLTMLFSVSNIVFAANTETTGGVQSNSDAVFSDISGHWAKKTISKLSDMGIVSGYPDGTFKPDNPVTRAELSKIISLAFDLKESGEINYSDIDNSAWYYQYLKCASRYIPVYSLPIENETNMPYRQNYEQDKNGFLPAEEAIRMHVAEALVEIKKEKENLTIEVPEINEIQQSLLQTFKDNDYKNLFAMHGSVPENVKRMFDYTWLAKEIGIMQGDTDGYFRPYSKITRAELLTMIERML